MPENLSAFLCKERKECKECKSRKRRKARKFGSSFEGDGIRSRHG
jgi:hypothetical protein